MPEAGKCEYPRVLLVNGEPFTGRSATGLTLRSLFRGWPVERLACVFVGDVEPDPGACACQWKLSGSDIPFARAMQALLGKTGGEARSQVSANRGVTAAGATGRREHWTERCGAYRAARAFANSQGLLQLTRYRVPASVMEEVKKFEPQVIYTMLGSNLMLSLVLDMWAQVRVPVVPHMMDDWPATLYTRSLFRPILRARLKRELRSVLSVAPVRLTIGREMAEEYARRYGGAFEPFMNAVEREWLVPSEPAAHEGARLRLTYVGGLHLNRWQSLREIGVAIADLRSEGVEAELIVHTQSRFAAESKLLEMPGVVRILGALDPSEVALVLRASDVLVHVESFDGRSRAYTRYSVSTKIPECMGAARPILAYGPEELASISYVSSSGAGVAVGRRDPTLLRNALRELLRSRDLRRELGARGFEVACRSHDASGQREQFRAVLAAAAKAIGGDCDAC